MLTREQYSVGFISIIPEWEACDCVEKVLVLGPVTLKWIGKVNVCVQSKYGKMRVTGGSR